MQWSRVDFAADRVSGVTKMGVCVQIYEHLLEHGLPVKEVLAVPTERDNVVYWKTKRKIKNDLHTSANNYGT